MAITHAKPHANKFYTGDNLYILNAMDSASVDLIYLDPPFNSKRLYSGTKGSAASGARFKDVWSWMTWIATIWTEYTPICSAILI